jgi:hypothetical protein
MTTKTKTDPALDRRHAGTTPLHSVIPAQAGIGLLTAALVTLLAACSSTEPPPPKAAKVAKRDWVTHVRSEAAEIASSVEVVPLVDPELEDLRATARTQESSGDLESATETLERAFETVP